MWWIKGLWERVRETVNRRRFEEEMDEELRYHIEREAERLQALGMDPEAARREAVRSFGETVRVKEDAREGSGIPWLETVLKDTRHALRGLRRSPVFAATAVATLALGLGATAAIFSIVDGVLLEPLPYPNPDRLVRFYNQNSPENIWNISVADFLAVEEEQQVFASVAALQRASVAFTGTGSPEQLDAAQVTADWFEVLGVEPEEGRAFRTGEDRPGAEPVVVLAGGFRDRAFGVDADVLGQSVTLDGVPHTVVGVLGEEWRALDGIEADVWPVLRLDPPTRRGPFPMRGVARLRPDHTLEDARADLEAISRRLFPVWAGVDFRDEEARLTPFPMREMLLGDVGGSLWLMLGAVVGVLLIAVSNVANLFLVRASGREREMALRASLGASRSRIAGQLLTESLVVAGLGGLLGLLVARAGLAALVAGSPSIPRIGEVALDGSVLGMTAVVTLGSALLFGLAPLARLWRAGPDSGAGAGVARGAGGDAAGWSRVRSALVTGEFAVAFSLTAVAWLLLGSFLNLQRVDPGYDPADVVAAQVSLPGSRYGDYEEVQAFWTEAVRMLSQSPGVTDAGMGAGLPPAGPASASTNNFDLVDRPVADGESEHVALWNYVSPGFLTALGIPLLRGRSFDERDRGSDEAMVLVSESWVRRFWPDGDPVGVRLYSGGDRSTAMTVVGVVGDVKYLGLDGSEDAAVYEPDWQGTLRGGALVVRSRAGSEAAATAIREAVARLDPELPVSAVQTMRERTAQSLQRPRQWTQLLGLFAGLGLLLACVGVYGVLSHYVGAQRKEIAIRVSLGAEPAAVRRMVVARGMWLAALGIGLGTVAALLLGRWLQALVFGVSPYDPAALATVALALAALAFLACALPARSATRIDPIVWLRGE